MQSLKPILVVAALTLTICGFSTPNVTAQYPQYQYPQYQQPTYSPNVYPTYSTPTYRPVQPGRVVYPNGTVITNPYRPNGIPAPSAPAIKARPVSAPTTLWFQGLLEDRDHDFGTVAYASKQEKQFEFINNTKADLFLTGIRTSCGCTKPRILTPHVKPGELAKVLAVFDTRAFYGKRGATVTVSMKKSGQRLIEYGELQLTVKGDIRRDVVLSPGEIDFKTISLSAPVSTTARIAYAGRRDWSIQEVRSTNPNIKAEVREIERNATTGRTTYEMLVRVSPDQAVGNFSDTLTIVTNDSKTSGMSFRVGGSVKPLIEVAPVTLGVVNKGQKIKKKLIVRSPRPISVDSIETGNDKIQFKPSEGKKTLHILEYTLDTSEPFAADQDITIVTRDEKIRRTKVPFSVQVVPSTEVKQGN